MNYLKPEITVLNPAVKKDVDLLTKELGDGFSVTQSTLDDNFWTVAADDALAPASSYLYDRKAGKVTKLFDQRPALAKAPLVPMQSLEIKARDGLTLVSYLSLPPGSDANGDGVPESPVPMVLNVHGGPWGRDTYGFENEHQWLANRGYAVLAVNFRASTGFGKAFVNAGNKEWAGKMHDDLLDAIDWAVKQQDHHQGQGRDLRRLVWRVCHAGGAHVHAGYFRLRRGYRRPEQSQHLVSQHPGVLEGLLRRACLARWRSAHRRRQEAVERALAALRARTQSRSRC